MPQLKQSVIHSDQRLAIPNLTHADIEMSGKCPKEAVIMDLIVLLHVITILYSILNIPIVF